MFDFLNTRFFRVYIIPGAVFQSVMIGGGYGTGREIVEYFTSYGFLGGLFGLCIAFVVLAIVLALTFEFSRLFQVYDYRNFFKRLLGRGWVAFEVLIILQFLLVLAVLASAAGNILRDNFGLPYGIGLSIMLVVVGTLTFYGRNVIAKVLTFWSFILYVVFFTFFISVVSSEWTQIVEEINRAEIISGWWRSGFKYAMYNLASAPLLLYVARGFERRAEALRSGVIAGAIAIVPYPSAIRFVMPQRDSIALITIAKTAITACDIRLKPLPRFSIRNASIRSLMPCSMPAPVSIKVPNNITL